MNRVIRTAVAGFVSCGSTAEENKVLAESYVRACSKRGAELILFPIRLEETTMSTLASRYGVVLAVAEVGEAIGTLYMPNGAAATAEEQQMFSRVVVEQRLSRAPETVFTTLELAVEEVE